jgi:D-glycero-alpha-D-manno-heptose-7-phosphate kinase
LAKAIYNRVVRDYSEAPTGFTLTTFVDAPAGSGLGTSSTLAVAILSAFAAWLGLPLGEYDLAHLAYQIERVDLGWAGGKQDQYAATFGGFNFMEFGAEDKVIVNPLRIRTDLTRELETNLVLYYMGTSRLSAKIIEAQTKNISAKNEKSLEGMHKLKEQAIQMKELILRGRLNELGPLLDFGWKYKKQTSDAISNPVIDELYETAIRAGATGGKISGAGGGGFMMFYCPGNARYDVISKLQSLGGEVRSFQFEREGVVNWTGQ